MCEKSGFDQGRFCTPPADDLTCSVCQAVLNDPVQSPCGHVFCRHCIITWLSTGSARRCPICSASLRKEQLTNAPYVLINLIKVMKLKCTYVTNGCERTLTVETVAKHEAECGHAPAKCAHSGCPIKLLRSQLASHAAQCDWRLVDCPHNCGGRYALRDKERHEGTCSNVMVRCSAGCGQKLSRGLLEQHLQKCPKKIIECSQNGCVFLAEQGARDQWDKHLQDHLELANKAIQEMTRLHNLHPLLRDTQAMALIHGRSVDWVARGVCSNWSSGLCIFSPDLSFSHFPTLHLRYVFRLLVKVNCQDSVGHVGVFFVPRRGGVDDTLQWPMSPAIQLEVLNVRGGRNKRDVLPPLAPASVDFFSRHSPPGPTNKEAWGFFHFLSETDLNSGNYTFSDSIVIRITLV